MDSEADEREANKPKAELYWKMYNEHATQARHHETLRGTISTILVSVSAGILSLHSANQNVAAGYGKYVALSLVVIGVLGSLLSYKNYERNRLHVSILGIFRAELDALLGQSSGIGQLNKRGRDAHKMKYPFWSRLGLHKLWTAIVILIIAAGLAVTFRS